MNRRTFVRAVGPSAVSGAATLAGCSGGGSDGNGGGGDETTTLIESSTPTTAKTETQTRTSTPTETGTDAPSSTPGSAASTTIAMETEEDSYYFDPIGLFVESGTTVIWTIESGIHSSTAYAESIGSATVTRIPKEATPWNSGTLSQQDATFEHIFETPGTYDYFCIPHKALGMVGRIVVGQPGRPAVGGMPPDGKVPTSQTIVEKGVVSYESFSPQPGTKDRSLRASEQLSEEPHQQLEQLIELIVT